ncbi:MAG: AAA family ATPase [Phycisphaerales bacterium]|nr:AAA family ATPase [Phycisphaerales bacterium]
MTAALAVVDRRQEPAEVAAERAVLGCMLVDAGTIPKVVSMLAAGDFSRARNALIHETIAALHADGAPVDVLSVHHRLEQRGEPASAWGGPAYLLDLQEACLAAADVAYHASIVGEAARARRINDTLRKATEAQANGVPPDEILAMLAGLQVQKAGAVRAPFLRPSEIAALPKRADVWHGILPVGGLCVLWGPYRSLKSFVVMALLAAIADGSPFLGRPTAAGSVLLVAGEGQRALLKRLRAAVGAARIADHGDHIHERFRIRGTMPNLLDAGQFNEFCAAIEQASPTPTALAIDTWARLCQAAGIDENANAEAGLLIARLNEIQARFGCAVIVVHHAGHAAGHARGATALPCAADTELRIERLDSGHGAPRCRLSYIKTKDEGEPPPDELTFGVTQVDDAGASSLFLDTWATETSEPKDKKASAADLLVLAAQAAGAAGLSFADAKQATGKVAATTSEALSRLCIAGLLKPRGDGRNKRWFLPAFCP